MLEKINVIFIEIELENSGNNVQVTFVKLSLLSALLGFSSFDLKSKYNIIQTMFKDFFIFLVNIIVTEIL